MTWIDWTKHGMDSLQKADRFIYRSAPFHSASLEGELMNWVELTLTLHSVHEIRFERSHFIDDSSKSTCIEST